MLVIGDSSLRGTEVPICRPDNLSREVCCLPGAHSRDIARRLLSLVKLEDYHLFLFFHVGTPKQLRTIGNHMALETKNVLGTLQLTLKKKTGKNCALCNLAANACMGYHE